MRDREWNNKISRSLIGHSISLETRDKIRNTVKRGWTDGVYKNRKIVIRRDCGFKIGHVQSLETIQKIKISRAGYRHSKETRDKIRKANKGQIPWNKGLIGMYSQERNKRVSEALKLRYLDPDFAKKMAKSCRTVPNKPEKILQEFLEKILPHQYAYCGNGNFIVAGKNPDFVHIGDKKKLIEFAGRYWYTEKQMEERARLFKKHGYDMLVVWEEEIKDICGLKKKLEAFNEQ